MSSPSRAGFHRAVALGDPVMQCLDLNAVPAATRVKTGRAAAMALYGVLNRIALPAWENIPDAAQIGSAGHPGTNAVRWVIPNTEIVLERVQSGPKAGQFLFSAETVAKSADMCNMSLPSTTPHNHRTVMATQEYQINTLSPPDMNSRRLIRMSFLACSFLLALAASPQEVPKNITVRPEDSGQALVNPGMGWTLHFYSNFIENYGSKLEPSDTLDDWPGLAVIYLRVPWAYLEPEEGKFNWSLFDTPAQKWAAKGKQIAIRVSCSESWIRYATPKWVQDAGAKGIDFEFGKGPRPGGPLWDPDYLDPVFLEKLDHFLTAMARRYDGNPNVAFIDIGSFGMWGEGHTGFSSRLNEEQTLEVTKKHIDLHVKHFPKTLLCISDDVAGSSKPGRHFPAMDYALAKGVTMRDDSIMVQAPPNSWYHAEMAQEFWPKLPVILEHEHYGSSKRRNAWSGELLLKSVEDYHASYMSIHWWPRELLQENREAIDRVNRRIGYRIQLREISWPREVPLGEPFTVETQWANAGVAPVYPGGFCCFTLKDKSGGIVSVNTDEDFDLRSLRTGPPGEAPVVRRQSQLSVAFRHLDPVGNHAPPTRPGVYDVFVSVGKRDGTPEISLPLKDEDGLRRYKVGQLRLLDRKPP